MKALAQIIILVTVAVQTLAQNLDMDYIVRCNDVLRTMKLVDRNTPAGDVYLSRREEWGRGLRDGGILPYKPVMCYRRATADNNAPVVDSVYLSQKDVDYIFNTLSERYTEAFRAKLCNAFGMIAREPDSLDLMAGYTTLTAPVFLHDNEVCVVYRQRESFESHSGGLEVYKKEREGWVWVQELMRHAR